MIVWKRQNYGDGKKGQWLPWTGGKMNKRSSGDFQGGKTTLYDTVMVEACHYTLAKIHKMYNRVNTNVNDGL